MKNIMQPRIPSTLVHLSLPESAVSAPSDRCHISSSSVETSYMK